MSHSQIQKGVKEGEGEVNIGCWDVEPSTSFSPFQSKLLWGNWYPVLKQYLYKHTATPPRPYTGRWVGIFSFRCQVFSNPIQSHYKHTAPVTNNTQHLPGAAHKVYTWISVTLSKIKGKGSFQIATKLACNGVICLSLQTWPLSKNREEGIKEVEEFFRPFHLCSNSNFWKWEYI